MEKLTCLDRTDAHCESYLYGNKIHLYSMLYPFYPALKSQVTFLLYTLHKFKRKKTSTINKKNLLNVE
jgi:hypothetical protein